MPRPLPFVLVFAAACSSSGTLAEGRGDGLAAVDRTPPAGARVFARPTWTEGDWFDYRKGGEVTSRWRVTRADEHGYELVEATSGVTLGLTRDLAETERSSHGQVQLVKDPADFELTWPLWVGKRWTSSFVEKRPGGVAEPIRARYRCEAIVPLVTTAGAKLECLRIVRTARLELPGRKFLEQTAILDYCPAIGWFARRIEDGLMSEISAWQRQAAGR